jgi:hypothetical protein
MIRQWMAILTACLASYAIDAQAADPVPVKAGAFVTFCATHFADCKNKIVEIDVAVMASMLFTPNGTGSCAIPKGIDGNSATKEILAWLANHKNSYAMNTDDAVQAAVKDLWHCQLQVGDGTVPGGPPAKTGAFVTYCSTEYAKCANKIVSVTVTVMVPDPPQHCSPPEAMKTKEMATAVVGWLQQHKETHNLDTVDGIMTAFDHLWPCH